MKTLNKYIWISAVVISIFFVSCEKVVHLDLNTAEPKIVIEGNITTGPEPYFVDISTTGDYYTAEGITPISGATVIVSDDIGTIDTLIEYTDGTYTTDKIVGISRSTYTINVIYNGKEYTGSDYLPDIVTIDSLTYELMDDGHPPNTTEDGKYLYIVYCYFTDPVETEDYYRINTYVNGEITGGAFSYYTLADDELFNGNQVKFGLWGIEALPDDTISVDLNCIGFNTFEYFRTLNDALNSGGGSTPYNPISNLSNDALGYFGTYTSDMQHFILEEPAQ